MKKLESEGIGRPSTYATIVETLKAREYVEVVDKRFFPTYLGYEVKDELVKNFRNIINVKFTANMEKDLDKVEEGLVEWVQLLSDFYDSLEKDIKKFEIEIEKIKSKRIVSDVLDSKGAPMVLKTGLYGKYLVSESNEKETVSLKKVVIPQEQLENGQIFVKEEVEKIQSTKKGILTDFFTEDGSRYLLKSGRFGEYLESENYEKDEKRMSLPPELKQKFKKGAIVEVDDILQINEEMTRILEENEKIVKEAGVCLNCGKPFEIKNGRFGKFLACTGYPDCKTIKNIKTGKITVASDKKTETKDKTKSAAKTAKKATAKKKTATRKTKAKTAKKSITKK